MRSQARKRSALRIADRRDRAIDLISKNILLVQAEAARKAGGLVRRPPPPPRRPGVRVA